MKEEKKKLVILKKKIAQKKVNLVSLKNLVVKEKKEREIILAEKIEEEKLAKKLAFAKKLEKEKVTLAKKIANKKKRLLAQKKERKRLASLKKKRLELKRKRELAEKKRKRLAIKKAKKVSELEKIDLFESDQVGDEVALFQESHTKKSKGFKPLKKWFKYALGYSTTPKNLEESDSGREALKGTITMNPHSYYFLGTTMSFDTNDYENIYYQPDFSYSFGYSDWHLDTFSWNYSNYANNKFSPKKGEDRFNFQNGNWELSYKTKVKDIRLTAKAKYLPAKNSKKVYIKAKKVLLDDVMLSAQLKHNITTKQNRLTLSAKTFIYDKFFVSGSVYEYYEEDSIRSLDGEYAYSFGWSDSKPYHPSITYSNYYTATRWDSDEGPHFNEGVLSVKFNIKF